MASNGKKKLAIVFNAPTVLGFTAICILALVLDQITNSKSTFRVFCVYRSSIKDFLTYVRLFGHVFGHANWPHFLNNIMMILVLGPLLEEKYGSRNIALVIALTSVITGLVHMIFFPNTYLLGASGVVFAFILLASLTSFQSRSIPMTFILVFVIYIGTQIYQGVFVEDNVSNLTHIVGGIVGAVFGYAKKGRRNG